MEVHKFGGASIATAERMHVAARIIKEIIKAPAVIVISAMGKTTNALEKVVQAFVEERQQDALQLFEQVKQQHQTAAKYVLVLQYNACIQQLQEVNTEVEWLLHDKPVRHAAYYYDQVVGSGELMSTIIMHHLLLENKADSAWVDVRDVLRTTNAFREARVDWSVTTAQCSAIISPLLADNKIVVTQGFIGSTSDNENTTLGREGSDFSAAIFANLLDAESQTIWKDVPSVLNADPKQFPDALPLPALNYEEVIEMAYYGAQVIHPKTIKPLYEKKIPLLVKCFLDPSLPGTVINNKKPDQLPPIYVVKQKQVMMTFTSTDYSFIGEKSVGRLYDLFEQQNLKPNLTQNGAIAFTAVFDENEEKISAVAAEASNWLQVMVQRDLTLITIRHYTKAAEQKMLEGKKVLLQQATTETLQALIA